MLHKTNMATVVMCAVQLLNQQQNGRMSFEFKYSEKMIKRYKSLRHEKTSNS